MPTISSPLRSQEILADGAVLLQASWKKGRHYGHMAPSCDLGLESQPYVLVVFQSACVAGNEAVEGSQGRGTETATMTRSESQSLTAAQLRGRLVNRLGGPVPSESAPDRPTDNTQPASEPVPGPGSGPSLDPSSSIEAIGTWSGTAMQVPGMRLGAPGIGWVDASARGHLRGVVGGAWGAGNASRGCLVNREGLHDDDEVIILSQPSHNPWHGYRPVLPFKNALCPAFDSRQFAHAAASQALRMAFRQVEVMSPSKWMHHCST